MLRAFLRSFLPEGLIAHRREKRKFLGKVSYSQEGEDLALLRLIGEKYTGFYIEIGAHHPVRFSNTYLFYRLGWRGICIDATPGSMKLFKKHRPRDICVETGVGETDSSQQYYLFNDPALNTFSKEKAEKVIAEGAYHLIGTQNIQQRNINSILSEYLVPAQIDFLSIDVEGLDELILKTFDFSRYHAQYVVLEANHFNLENLESSGIHRLMKAQHYRLISKLDNSLIYQR
jgi:hypothetical protein